MDERTESDLRDYLREGMHVGRPINKGHICAAMMEIDELRAALSRAHAPSEEERLRAALVGLKRAIEHAVEGKSVPNLKEALNAASDALAARPEGA